MIDEDGEPTTGDMQMGAIYQLSDKPCRAKKPKIRIGFQSAKGSSTATDRGNSQSPKCTRKR